MATELTVPITEEQIRSLKIGDQVLLNGVIFTGRDAAHKYMIDNFVKGTCPAAEQETYEILKKGLAGGVIYHCGPVVRKRDDGKYEFVAAGPTTSIREEPYQADVIGHFGVRGVIGKGGMRDKTLKGCQEHGAVYLHAIGGAATLIAESVKEVVNVPQAGLRRSRSVLGDPRGGFPVRRDDGLARAGACHDQGAGRVGKEVQGVAGRLKRLVLSCSGLRLAGLGRLDGLTSGTGAGRYRQMRTALAVRRWSRAAASRFCGMEDVRDAQAFGPWIRAAGRWCSAQAPGPLLRDCDRAVRRRRRLWKQLRRSRLSQGGPRLELSPTVFNFGEVWEGMPARQEFAVKNTGDAPLTLTLKTYCGCTPVTRPKSPLPPGESTTFTVSYSTKRKGPATTSA